MPPYGPQGTGSPSRRTPFRRGNIPACSAGDLPAISPDYGAGNSPARSPAPPAPAISRRTKADQGKRADPGADRPRRWDPREKKHAEYT